MGQNKILILIKNILILGLLFIFAVLCFVIPYILVNLINKKNTDFNNFYFILFMILFYVPYIIYFIIRKNEIKSENIISIKPIKKNIFFVLKYFVLPFIIFFIPFLILEIFNLIDIKLFMLNSSKLKIQKMIYILFQFLNFLLVGFIEELLFRGIIFNRLLKVFKISAAILISSLLFSFYHFSILEYILADINIKLYFKNSLIQDMLFFFINIFIISITLSLLKIRTKSIHSSIGYHFGYNFFLSIFFYNSLPNNTSNSILWIPILRFIPHFNYPQQINIFKFHINTPHFIFLIIFLSQLLYLILIIIDIIIKNRKELKSI